MSSPLPWFLRHGPRTSYRSNPRSLANLRPPWNSETGRQAALRRWEIERAALEYWYEHVPAERFDEVLSEEPVPTDPAKPDDDIAAPIVEALKLVGSFIDAYTAAPAEDRARFLELFSQYSGRVE